ncbi:TPA: PD-(D/E)XK nuclease-like domain-containing protein [Salmonella enterica subsp. enterica serovar Aberdeen]|uniref:DNA breaking-rejoining protein n=1 Tax=Salmonella enterica subsp. enterica serovar Aberdeen TaxID=260367 RepID=A0A5I4KJY6_SALET|nr:MULTISPECIES: RecE family exodeoxyribonuclease [Salmonella]EAA8422482.1 DNA breaking-rejoining protein [Salmonella enterica subsp. enterica]EAB5695602.1 DNA breaking-rejoining protein [Salmonella enterica subsp. enterica serovar Aberdeen]ECO1505052.1 DNA breaking-rejoining protein [Salmonella enterica subsp. enterica serovar Virchow]EDT7471476.1 DNA breaking-rejoining protein [Salmonella enterica subsp. enterica serovar Pretoria]EDW4979067.1 DNA breaking-rejoining protein [Salmonella enteri
MSIKQEEYSFYYKVKNESARKRLGFKAGFFWCTAKKQSLALSRGELAMDAAGFDEADFARPVRVHFPVENDIPPEGVFDTKFCENREPGGEDGKTLTLIPGAASAVKSDETERADGAGTPAGENGIQESHNPPANPQLTVVATLPFRHRVLAQYIGDGEYLYHVDTGQKKEIACLEMDTQNTTVQNLILAAENVEPFKKAIEHDIHKAVNAYKQVFPVDGKVPELCTTIKFFKEWFSAEHINRGLLVKEWAERLKNKPAPVKKTGPHKVIVDDVNKPERPRRSEKPTHRTINYELACGFCEELDLNNLRPAMDFAKRIIAEDREDWKRMSMTVGIIPDIKGYDRQTIIDLVRKAPKAVHNGNPDLRRTWCESFLAVHGVRDPDWYEYAPDNTPTTHEENAARLRQAGKCLRDIEAGRFQCDEEKPQPAGELADEPATPEAVEQDTTEHHPDPQPLENEPPVSQTEAGYQKIRAELYEARKNIPPKSPVDVGKQLAAARGEYVEGISDPNDPKWVKTGTSQPTTEPELVKNVGNGIFDVSALMQNSSTHGTETNPEITSNVQVQEADSDEKQAGDAVQAGEGDLGTGKEAVTVEAETHQNNDSVSQSEPEAQQNVPESQQEEPEAAWPEYFEPGRYEGVPNEVYHAANGISSTQVKDARVSLMYFNARHVEKTIVKERSPVLDMGNLVHALALQPENLEAEFSVEPEIPEGAFTTTATLREFIDAHNASLPALLSADDIKALLEKYNATLPSQMPLGASVDETYASYEQLPEEFQRIENGTKHTATAMKACIKEYNATLPAPVKTSGSRDALLEQLAIINPDLVAQEAQKSSPLKVSGTKADLIQAVKSVNPAAVFADELLDAWRENTEGKVLVTRQQLSTALNIQKALLEHPTAGKLLTHPSRAVEVSYFGIDEETGLEVRVRPDLELDMGGLRIGADLKTISMWNIKQEGLRAKLHREIIDRDYHLSAAMYCETAALDQFFWIFVNKDENYHWVAIIEASTELLELGMLEYRKTMRAIANGFDTGEWPAPITEDYTDELNDFDVRRLEALRVQA